MNIVIMSTCYPSAVHYLISRIQSEFPVKKIIIPIWQGNLSLQSLLSKFRKLTMDRVLLNIEFNLFYKWYNKKLDQQMNQFLFKGSKPPSISNFEKIPVANINKESTANLIRTLGPDILLVCMAPVLKPEIFLIPRIATVNIHFGIAPAYRGENTIFWPLYQEDYENIGITLHCINKGIDTGPILAQGFPSIERYDTEATLWSKCAQMAVELIFEYLSTDNSRQIAGQLQETKGHLFYKRDRKIWRDIHYQMKYKFLNRKPVPQPLRKIRYF